MKNAVENMKAGDIEPFWRLVEPHRKGVKITAYCMLDSANEAEQAVSATLLKAFDAVLSPRDAISLKALLQKMTIEECRARVREARSDTESHSSTLKAVETSPLDNLAEWKSVGPDVLENKEVWKCIYSGLKSLTPANREVFILRDIQHFTLAETANILSIAVDKVLQLLHCARVQMRECLHPEFKAEARSTCG